MSTTNGPVPPEGDAPVGGETTGADDSPREGGFTHRRRAATETVTRWRDVGVERAEDIERRFWPVVVAHQFYDRFRAVNGVVLAGHLAFRAFSFLLPLAFGFVAVAGALHATGRDPAETANNLKLGEAVANSMRSAGDQSGEAPVQVAFGALLTLLLGSLGLLSGLHYVYAQAWQMSVRKIEKRAGKVVRFILAFVLTFTLLMVSSSLRRGNAFLGLASVLATGALIAVLFVGLAAIMPHRSEGVLWLVPGGLVGAVGVVGLQAFATFYLPGKLESFSSTYGALGVAAVVISYLYLVGLMVVASALASAVWYDHRTSDGMSPVEQAAVDEIITPGADPERSDPERSDLERSDLERSDLERSVAERGEDPTR